MNSMAKKKWNDWVVDLSRIKGIVISRCIYDSLQQEVLECCLHGFSDVSNKSVLRCCLLCLPNVGQSSREIVDFKVESGTTKGTDYP